MSTGLNKHLTTKGVGISSETLMINNSLGTQIYNKVKQDGILIDITGNAPDNIAGIAGADKAFKDKDFYIKLADSMQRDINATGGNLKEDYYKENSKLLNTYFLLLGLAYVSIESKDGDGKTVFLATKNNVVLKPVLHWLGINNVSPERVEKLADKRIVTNKELNEKHLSVIKFYYDSDMGSWRVGTARIYPSSKKTHIFPYIPLKWLSRGIIEFLCRCRGKITYGDNRVVYSAFCDARQYHKAIKGLDKDACLLRLFDYNTQAETELNTLDIHSISRL